MSIIENNCSTLSMLVILHIKGCPIKVNLGKKILNYYSLHFLLVKSMHLRKKYIEIFNYGWRNQIMDGAMWWSVVICHYVSYFQDASNLNTMEQYSDIMEPWGQSIASLYLTSPSFWQTSHIYTSKSGYKLQRSCQRQDQNQAHPRLDTVKLGPFQNGCLRLPVGGVGNIDPNRRDYCRLLYIPLARGAGVRRRKSGVVSVTPAWLYTLHRERSVEVPGRPPVTSLLPVKSVLA